MENLFEHYRFEVDKSQYLLRIDKYLLNRIKYATRNRIQNAAKENKILVNNIPVKVNYRVKPGDIITIVMNEPKKEKDVLAENINLNIVYEDNYLMVINKPHGMVVHPGFNNYSGTLLNALLFHFENIPDNKLLKKPGLVHRLDKNTSGLMIIAKQKESLDNLLRQFYYHSIIRNYRLLVWGILKEKEGKISTNLIKDEKNKKMINSENGKIALTNYKVIEEFGFFSLVECRLETGKTHQIRLHLSSIGHPIIGDEIYGYNIVEKLNNELNLITDKLKRQALHSYSLSFSHPVTNKTMNFTCDLPDDMKNIIDIFKS